MQNQIVNPKFQESRFKVDEFLKELHHFTVKVENESFQKIISDLRSNINEPFLFVVVGEVKSGKSSFVNALLKSNVCKVDAAPCTDTVQQIVYSDEPTETMLNPYLKRIGEPAEILKTIAIVDTPGTNTIVQHHQEITEKFIPNSDLVMFVFPAKNPYTQSAWDLLDFVNEEWRKKVIFILQQADLARPEELKTNIEKVKEYAIQRKIESPLVFATSAILEINGNDGSGFNKIRQYINETVTGGKHYKLKLLSNLKTSEQIIGKISESLENHKNQLAKDKALVEKIKTRLSSGEQQSTYEIKSLVDRLVANYDRISGEVKEEFEEGLSVFSLFKRTFSSIFNKDKSMKAWIKDLQSRFEKRLQTSFEEIANDGAKHFLGGIRHLLHDLLEDLNRVKDAQKETEDIYVKIGEERANVIEDVRAKVSDLLSNESFSKFMESNPASLAPTALGGGILGILGIIILTTTKIAFLDITGGILTGIGVIVAGSVLLFKKSKIVRQFKEGLNEGKVKFETELTEKLTSKLKLIYEDIDRSFLSFYEYTQKEEEKVEPLLLEFEEIKNKFQSLSGSIQTKF